MSNDEINWAIAESMGWKWYRRPATGPWADKPHRSLYHLVPEYTTTLQLADMTERECNPAFIMREGLVVNYTADLNAMHEAEKTIAAEKWHVFIRQLNEVVCADDDEPLNQDPETCWGMIHATARQRSEAFLRTLGLWTP